MNDGFRRLFRLIVWMLSLTAGAAIAASRDEAQAVGGYPSRPVRLVVPFPPGSPSDILARIIGEPLAQRLGRTVVIDNRAGAGGLSGVELVASAQPDGYTLVLGGTGALAISPGLRATMPFNVGRDFAPVTLAAAMPQMLVTGPQVPAGNIAELMALAKTSRASLNFASGGTGTVAHLAGELFKNAAKIEATHVPYRGGTPAAVTEMIAGQVQFMFSGVAVLMPYVKSGRLKGIAVAAGKRSLLAPHLPTVIEAGIPGFTIEVWVGVLAPAKSPSAVIVKLNGELNALLKSQAVQDRMLALGAEAAGGSPEQFRAFMAAETDKWRHSIRSANLKEE